MPPPQLSANFKTHSIWCVIIQEPTNHHWLSTTTTRRTTMTTAVKAEFSNSTNKLIKPLVLELVEQFNLDPAEVYYYEPYTASEITETYYIVQATRDNQRLVAMIETYDYYCDPVMVIYNKPPTQNISLQLDQLTSNPYAGNLYPLFKQGYNLHVADISKCINIKKISVGGQDVTQVIKLNTDNEDKETNCRCNLLAQLELYLFNEYGIKPCIVDEMLKFFNSIINDPEDPYTEGSVTHYPNNLKNGDIIYYTGLSRDKEVKEWTGEPTGNKEEDETTEAMLALHNLLINV